MHRVKETHNGYLPGCIKTGVWAAAFQDNWVFPGSLSVWDYTGRGQIPRCVFEVRRRQSVENSGKMSLRLIQMVPNMFIHRDECYERRIRFLRETVEMRVMMKVHLVKLY
jgi:hypothetical protein